ncbi:MAG: TIR domain-containing protein [Thermoleophilia bacterium]
MAHVFLSYDFSNEPECGNVRHALDARGVKYWGPSTALPGASLRDQLRSAIDGCCACIFVATRASIESRWCGAELGAFWGLGRPIIVYLAEASLADADLPEVVRGDVWERELHMVAERAADLVAQSGGAVPPTSEGRSVGDLSVDQLTSIIQSAISLSVAEAKETGTAPTEARFGDAARGIAGRLLTGFKEVEAARLGEAPGWKTHILWVDDRPDNNVFERGAMEEIGLRFTLATSTQGAWALLSKERFGAIISDMGRPEGPRAGYELLALLRHEDAATPFFIYAGSRRWSTVARPLRGGPGMHQQSDGVGCHGHAGAQSGYVRDPCRVVTCSSGCAPERGDHSRPASARASSQQEASQHRV